MASTVQKYTNQEVVKRENYFTLLGKTDWNWQNANLKTLKKIKNKPKHKNPNDNNKKPSLKATHIDLFLQTGRWFHDIWYLVSFMYLVLYDCTYQIAL